MTDVKHAAIAIGLVAVALFVVSRTSLAPYFGLTQQKLGV